MTYLLLYYENERTLPIQRLSDSFLQRLKRIQTLSKLKQLKLWTFYQTITKRLKEPDRT